LKLHYAWHAFPGIKSTKSFGLPALRFGPLLWMVWRRHWLPFFFSSYRGWQTGSQNLLFNCLLNMLCKTSHRPNDKIQTSGEATGVRTTLCYKCDVIFSYIYTNTTKCVIHLSYLVRLD